MSIVQIYFLLDVINKFLLSKEPVIPRCSPPPTLFSLSLYIYAYICLLYLLHCIILEWKTVIFLEIKFGFTKNLTCEFSFFISKSASLFCKFVSCFCGINSQIDCFPFSVKVKHWTWLTIQWLSGSFWQHLPQVSILRTLPSYVVWTFLSRVEIQNLILANVSLMNKTWKQRILWFSDALAYSSVLRV